VQSGVRVFAAFICRPLSLNPTAVASFSQP
jgi:hypothetical protein